MWLVCEGNEAPVPPARPERNGTERSGTERKPNLGRRATRAAQGDYLLDLATTPIACQRHRRAT
eukprot:5800367-Prymnesium_polylepis.1